MSGSGCFVVVVLPGSGPGCRGRIGQTWGKRGRRLVRTGKGPRQVRSPLCGPRWWRWPGRASGLHPSPQLPSFPFHRRECSGKCPELLPCGDDRVLFPLCIPSCLVCPPLEQGLERAVKTGLGASAGGRGKVREKRPPGWSCSHSRPGAPRERGPLAVPGVSFPGCFRLGGWWSEGSSFPPPSRRPSPC